MSPLAARRTGSTLLIAGGLLLAAGTFLPQIFRTGSSQSHWTVLEDAWEMLIEPSPYLPRDFSLIYAAAQIIGLTYPVIAGLLIAAGGLLGRSRIAAAAAYLFHLGCFWILAVFALALAGMRVSGDAAGDAKNGVMLVGAGALLAAVLFIEIVLVDRAGRPGPRPRRPLMDAVNLPPAAFLLLLHAALYIILRSHPNWPSAGYAVGAAGAGLAITGMILRRRASP